jgi:hypothetical protein
LQDWFIQAIFDPTAFNDILWDKLTMGHPTWIARDQADQAEGEDGYAEEHCDKLDETVQQRTVHLLPFNVKLSEATPNFPSVSLGEAQPIQSGLVGVRFVWVPFTSSASRWAAICSPKFRNFCLAA